MVGALRMRQVAIWILIGLWPGPVFSDKLLIPMDEEQTDHLKAYGIAYFALKNGADVEWLLNYRGGSFMMDYGDLIGKESRLRGVSAVRISESETAKIVAVMA